jgi:glucokinase
MISLNASAHDSGQAIGLDVGGTKIAGGVVTAHGYVVERMPPMPSPATDQEATLSALYRVIADLRARHPAVEAIGVGAAGMVNFGEGRIIFAPNNAYQELSLQQFLEDATGLPVIVDNDSNAACWAEFRAGLRASHMAFLTVGTGVGGGLIIDGRLFRGKTGIGTEVGHMIVDPHGTHRCGCGNLGCLETLASGSALGRYGRAAAAAEPNGVLAELAGGAARVTGEIVSAAARDGDPTALALLAKLGHWLGIGIATLVNLFDVELVVVGGGVSAVGDPLLEPTRSNFERYVFARSHRRLPNIVPARLGVEAGWIGAAMLALTQHDQTGPTTSPGNPGKRLAPLA